MARRTTRRPDQRTATRSKKAGAAKTRRTGARATIRKTDARTAKGRRPDLQVRSKKPRSSTVGPLTVTEVDALDDLRRELERVSRSPARWNADPEDVQRSVAQLVLTLVEFVRKLLERQAIRRMEAGTLTPAQTEDVGRALMLLESTLREIALRFGLDPDELNLELGPLGRLM